MDEMQQLVKGNFRTQPVSSCVFSVDDLKKLYLLLAEKAKEAAELEVKEFQQQKVVQSEDPEVVKKKIYDAFKLTAFVSGTKGEHVVFIDASVITPETMPEDVQGIGMGCGYLYKMIFNTTPRNQFEVHLDFTKSKLLDFTNLWSLPEESKNYIRVQGNKDTWVNGVFQSIVSFFGSRAKRRNWLHARHTYDLLLWSLGIPAILWAIFRLNMQIRPTSVPLPNVLLVAIYLYTFFSGLFLFRLLFNYARWTFPQYEYKTKEGTKPGKHRWVLGTILLAVVGSLIADIIKCVF